MNDNSEKKNKSKKAFALIIAFVLVIIVAGVGGYFIHDRINGDNNDAIVSAENDTENEEDDSDSEEKTTEDEKTDSDTTTSKPDESDADGYERNASGALDYVRFYVSNTYENNSILTKEEWEECEFVISEEEEMLNGNKYYRVSATIIDKEKEGATDESGQSIYKVNMKFIAEYLISYDFKEILGKRVEDSEYIKIK